MISGLNLASALTTLLFTLATIIKLISQTRSNCQSVYRTMARPSLTSAKYGFYLLQN